MASYSPPISLRALNTPASPIRRLVPLADKAEKAGVTIYHLNIGQPDLKPPSVFLQSIKAYASDIVAYEDSRGNQLLRQALVDYYRKCGITITSDEVLVTTGGSEAILFALLSTCDPGDECLVTEPCYANYMGFAAMASVRLRGVRTRPENGFHLPDESVWERAITPKTRALMITNPNNPTGTVYTHHELLMINHLAHKHDLFVIADETYREIIFDGNKHESFLNIGNRPQHVILVDSLSKRYSLCGARIGCLASYNQQVLESATKFCQARLASPTLEQEACISVLRTPKKVIETVRLEYQHRRDVVLEGLIKIPGVFVKKPEGALYCVVKLPVKDAEKFSSWLLTDFRLRNETIMLAPAAGFYLSLGLGKDEVRLAYVLNTKNLARAIAILAKALADYTEK